MIDCVDRCIHFLPAASTRLYDLMVLRLLLSLSSAMAWGPVSRADQPDPPHVSSHGFLQPCSRTRDNFFKQHYPVLLLHEAGGVRQVLLCRRGWTHSPAPHASLGLALRFHGPSLCGDGHLRLPVTTLRFVIAAILRSTWSSRPRKPSTSPFTTHYSNFPM